MTLETIIAAILQEFPQVLQSEIADALCIGEQTVRRYQRRAGIAGPGKGVGRQKNAVNVRAIKSFLDKQAGAELEVIILRGEHPAICIGGRLIA